MPSNETNAFLSSVFGRRGLGGALPKIAQLMQAQDREKADEANRQFLQDMATKRFGLEQDRVDLAAQNAQPENPVGVTGDIGAGYGRIGMPPNMKTATPGSGYQGGFDSGGVDPHAPSYKEIYEMTKGQKELEKISAQIDEIRVRTANIGKSNLPDPTKQALPPNIVGDVMKISDKEKFNLEEIKELFDRRFGHNIPNLQSKFPQSFGPNADDSLKQELGISELYKPPAPSGPGWWDRLWGDDDQGQPLDQTNQSQVAAPNYGGATSMAEFMEWYNGEGQNHPKRDQYKAEANQVFGAK